MYRNSGGIFDSVKPSRTFFLKKTKTMNKTFAYDNDIYKRAIIGLGI